MIRSLIFSIIFLFSVPLSAAGHLEWELDLRPFFSESMPYEKLVLEAEAIDARIVLSSGRTYTGALPQDLPPVLEIREMTINGPEVTVRLIKSDGDYTTRRVDSLFLSFTQEVINRRRHVQLETAWSGIHLVKAATNVPKTLKALGGHLIGNLIFEGRSDFHLCMSSELNEDFIQQLISVGATQTTIPSHYEGIFDVEWADQTLHLDVVNNGRQIGYSWDFAGDLTGHTAGLDRVLSSMQSMHKVWAKMKPENKEQAAIKKILSSGSLIADATAPLRRWSGVRFHAAGDLSYHKLGESDWDLTGSFVSELYSKFKNWHIGFSNDFSASKIEDELEWRDTLTLMEPTKILTDMSHWLCTDALNFLAEMTNTPSLTRYAYLGQRFEGAMYMLLETVGEPQPNGDLCISLAQQADGDLEIGYIKVKELTKSLISKLTSGWGWW